MCGEVDKVVVFVPVFSEPEPGLGGAGVAPASVQPHLRPSALLGSDSDPHLPGLPGPNFRLGATAELVRDVDPPVRVSGTSGTPSTCSAAAH